MCFNSIPAFIQEYLWKAYNLLNMEEDRLSKTQRWRDKQIFIDEWAAVVHSAAAGPRWKPCKLWGIQPFYDQNLSFH